MESQNNCLKEINGWEFLEWKLTKKEVDKLLKQKGIEIEYTYSNAETGTRIRIRYQELETWLYFDLSNQLKAVEQHKDFNVVDDKEAGIFFEKVKSNYIKKYGMPGKEKNDKKKEIWTLKWYLKHTKICIVYDYKYKIIDELGCGSYSVEIRVTPVR